MSPQPDPSTLVDGVLAAAAHLEPELEEALAEHHLSRPSFQVLSALLDADGHALTQRELMAQVRRTSGTMSVRLARLERAGLVTREPDAEDRRSVTVTLTDSGRELVEAARPAYDAGGRAPRRRPPRRRARDLRRAAGRLAGLLRARRRRRPAPGGRRGARGGRLAHAPRGRAARAPRHPRAEGQALQRRRQRRARAR